MYLRLSVKPTIGGLNNSLRSVKLDRNRVRGVSIGSSRMTEEFDVTLFSNFFRDAAKLTLKRGFQDKKNLYKIILSTIFS